MTTLLDLYAQEGIKPPRKSAPKAEWVFQECAVDYLRHNLPGAVVWGNDNGQEAAAYVKIARRNRGIEPGQPDIRILRNGVSVDIELKVGNNVLSEDQEKRRKELERNCGHWFCCRTLAHVEVVLRQMQWPVVMAADAFQALWKRKRIGWVVRRPSSKAIAVGNRSQRP